MTVAVFDPRPCILGEGPLWHPTRNQLFWFDILGKKLLSENGQEWAFDEHVSAAGWVSDTVLLIASESELFRFDLTSGARQPVVPLEADNPLTRSNDGRADPQGGFWIGTMGKQAEPEAGAIYRYYRGALRQLFDKISITNSICFAPDGTCAYFADTRRRQITQVALDRDGWPVGDPSVFVDLQAEGVNPDGSVVDAQGCLWNAQWGAHRVARYDTRGQFLQAISFPAEQISCPAFGGADLKTLFATSAADGLDGVIEGQTFALTLDVAGQPEHRVLL
ncbi:SMP-30/gluconolactonase/LRE family protein [Roseobacter sp. N2S]|uniref:SMP-30/gluconolactonase/LRE family protein n=1 Tax=Roseobacter sp. N2S TaxID=2663844 RepID=UPI002862883F|nr:SMP-30/gluconolactonase/LRE family protein [Roseobacter sp. N2S]MDR6263894.1 sugar lactone lactonase YvrE [Roseobacter sp. N2S]